VLHVALQDATEVLQPAVDGLMVDGDGAWVSGSVTSVTRAVNIGRNEDLDP
jgi:hypothetical protein